MVSVQEKAMCVLWVRETKSPVTVTRFYRKEFRKGLATEQLLRCWLNQFQETGHVLHQKGAGRPSISTSE